METEGKMRIRIGRRRSRYPEFTGSSPIYRIGIFANILPLGEKVVFPIEKNNLIVSRTPDHPQTVGYDGP